MIPRFRLRCRVLGNSADGGDDDAREERDAGTRAVGGGGRGHERCRQRKLGADSESDEGERDRDDEGVSA